MEKVMVNEKALIAKVLSAILAFLLILFTAPFSPAEALSRAPLGAVISAGSISVGAVAVPTGTTLFAGDKLAASGSPALINLSSGSRVEMSQAAAVFSRAGNTLVIEADQGLLRFYFQEGENVQINAGNYVFSTVGERLPHVGELGLGRNGEIAMNTTQGAFAVLNVATGSNSQVDANKPLIVEDQEGYGTIAKNSRQLTDSSKSWKSNELKGKCVVAGSEAYAIEGNSRQALTIKGSWKFYGTAKYKIMACTRDALIEAGASAASADVATGNAPVTTTTAGGGGGGGKTAAIVAGVAAGGGGPAYAIYQATKSSSSR